MISPMERYVYFSNPTSLGHASGKVDFRGKIKPLPQVPEEAEISSSADNDPMDSVHTGVSNMTMFMISILILSIYMGLTWLAFIAQLPQLVADLWCLVGLGILYYLTGCQVVESRKDN